MSAGPTHPPGAGLGDGRAHAETGDTRPGDAAAPPEPGAGPQPAGSTGATDRSAATRHAGTSASPADTTSARADGGSAPPAPSTPGGTVPASARQRYREAVVALAAPLQDRIAGRDRAQQQLVAGRRALAERLAESAARVAEADAALATARRDARAHDTDVARLWRELGGLFGRRRDGLGEVPAARPPDPAHAGPASALLERARHTVAAARRGELPLSPPVPIWVAMLIAGVLGAGVLVGVGKALSTAAYQMPRNEQAAMGLIATIAFLAAPAGGIPVGLMWLTRYGRPLTVRALALLLGAGIVVGYGLWILLSG